MMMGKEEEEETEGRQEKEEEEETEGKQEEEEEDEVNTGVINTGKEDRRK